MKNYVQCDGGYTKVGPKQDDMTKFGDPTPCNIMFDPDKRGYTKEDLIFNHKVPRSGDDFGGRVCLSICLNIKGVDKNNLPRSGVVIEDMSNSGDQ